MEARRLSLQFPASTLNRILFPHLYPTHQHFPPCWWLFLRVFPLKAFLFPPAPKSPFGLTTVLRMYVAGARKSFLGPGSLLPPSFDCGHASPGDSWRGKYNKKGRGSHTVFPFRNYLILPLPSAVYVLQRNSSVQDIECNIKYLLWDMSNSAQFNLFCVHINNKGTTADPTNLKMD